MEANRALDIEYQLRPASLTVQCSKSWSNVPPFAVERTADPPAE